jgi:hypothetical protein
LLVKVDNRFKVSMEGGERSAGKGSGTAGTDWAEFFVDEGSEGWVCKLMGCSSETNEGEGEGEGVGKEEVARCACECEVECVD